MFNLGIDIGGGSAKIALIDGGNTIAGGPVSVETGQRDMSEVIGEINEEISRLLGAGNSIGSVGIAMTGINHNGVIHHCEMLRHWVGGDLNEVGKGILDTGVHVCNDALGAAYSLIPLVNERAHNILYLTLGSGLGGTLLEANGTITPLEPGQSIDPITGTGTIESYTGREALKAELIDLLKGWHHITLDDPDSLSLEDIERIVLSGEINFSYTENLGRTVTQQLSGIRDKCTQVRNNLVRRLSILAGILAPTHQAYTVVLGGGPASGDPDFLIKPLEVRIASKIASCGNHPFFSKTPLRVIQSPHGKNSGVVGAAIYGQTMQEKATA